MRLVSIPERVRALERDLRRIFGARLHAFVAYGLRAQTAGSGAHDDGGAAAGHGPHHTRPAPAHTLGIVDVLSSDDLRACAAHVDAWHDKGLATPLLVAAHEFGRSLDAFPFEFGAILSDYVLVSGTDPFDGLRVEPADLRRACEIEARGHLLHLREGYLETGANGDAVAVLVVESAPAFAALVTSVAHLDAAGARDAQSAARHVTRRLALPSSIATEIVALTDVTEISSTEALRLFPPYLDAVDRLVKYIDIWR
jgi:hypothetical protein